MILHEIFRVVSRFPQLNFMFYSGKSITFLTVYTVQYIAMTLRLGSSHARITITFTSEHIVAETLYNTHTVRKSFGGFTLLQSSL